MVKKKLSPQELEDLRQKSGIYTDWANHYLEKARHKRHIVDLQNDVSDGVLLADVIEAVTGEKVKDIKPKPKNSAQMVENINTSLAFLANLGVSVEGVSAKDIKDGNLKSILGLFFSLSRYKQQQKTLLQQQQKQQQQQQRQLQQQQQQQQQRQGGDAATVNNHHHKNSNSSGIPQSGSKSLMNGGESISRLPSFKQSSSGKPSSLAAGPTASLSSSASASAAASSGQPPPTSSSTSSTSPPTSSSTSSSSSSQHPSSLGYNSTSNHHQNLHSLSRGSNSSNTNKSPYGLPSGSSNSNTSTAATTERGRSHQNQQPQTPSSATSSNSSCSGGGGGGVGSNGGGSGNNGSNNGSNNGAGPSSLIPLRAGGGTGGTSNNTGGGPSRATSPGVTASPNNNNNNNNSGIPAPASTGIPTPSGRGIPTSRSGNLADKQSNRTSAGSTTSSSSNKSNPSSKPPAASNKNSMLDKFKFFKDKDKDKEKDKDKSGKGVVKSASKSSSASGSSSTTTASGSSRSDTDSSRASSSTNDTAKSSSTYTSSRSGGSSSDAATSGIASGPISPQHSGAAGVSGVANYPSSSLKSTGKSGKKSSLARAFSSSKKDPPETQPPPIPSAQGLGPPTGGITQSVPSSRNGSPSQARKSSSSRADPRQMDPRLVTASPTPVSASSSSSKKASKIGGLSSIPKSSSSSGKSSSAKSSSSSSANTPSSSSSIPSSSSSTNIPSSSSSSAIPKPNSSKSVSKSGRDEKGRKIESSNSKSGEKNASSSKQSTSSSSQHHQQQMQQHYNYQQQQQQQQHSNYPQPPHPYHAHQQQQHHYPHHHQQQQQQQQYPGYSQQAQQQHYSPYHGNQPYNTPQAYTPPYAHNPGYATPSTRVPSSPVIHNVHPRVNMQSLERQQQQHQTSEQAASAFNSNSHPRSNSSQASHYVPVTIPAVNMETHPSSTRSASTSSNSAPTNSQSPNQNNKQRLPQSPMMSPSLGRYGTSGQSPSVNIVKPTVAAQSTSAVSSPASIRKTTTKSDSNTQTNLSVLHRTITPRPYTPAASSNQTPSKPSPQSSPSVTSKHDNHTSTSNTANSVESKTNNKASTPEKVLEKGSSSPSHRSTSDDSKKSSSRSKSSSRENLLDSSPSKSGSTKDVSNNGSPGKPILKDPNLSLASSNPVVNSPKLGVKMLGTHLTKSNVAVVQPRSGDKMETTFDAEVRTETINNKMNGGDADGNQPSGKETTFLTPDKEEKDVPFLDDQGEAMDIKPMPPIMRALPYGYFRGYTGYGGFNNRNFHIPGISVPTTNAIYATRTGSAQGLGMPRPLGDQGGPKFYSGHVGQQHGQGPHSGMRRQSSGNGAGNGNGNQSEGDYASESDSYDYVSGYMSDGDILKANRSNGTGSTSDDWASGYLSEGGASLYARRLQQRFREGMQAVKECMQKSSGMIDDDSFDDSSSISSGEISDTIAEISTDENVTGNAAGGAVSDNPYSSIKRGPKDALAFHSGSYPNGSPLGKRTPNLGTSAYTMHPDYSSDSGYGPIGPGSGVIPSWGRKYSLTGPGSKFLSNDPNKLLSSDPVEYGWPSSRSDCGGYSSLRKLSNPDYAYHSEGDYDTPSHLSRPFSPSMVKRDSETNTDQSHLLEASMRRHLSQVAQGRGNTVMSSGGSGMATPPSSNGPGTQFGYRRPLSNVSNSSGGSGGKQNGTSNGGSKSSGSGSSAVGSRLAKHGVDGVPRPESADPLGPRNMGKNPMLPSHGSLDDYSSASSMERKRKGSVGLTPSKSTGCTQTDRDYQSNSLGRRRLFGSKNNMNNGNNMPGGSPHSDPASPLVGGTIISNPHATYASKQPSSHYVNLQELHARIPGSNYVPLEFASSPRNSVLGPGSMWLKSSTSAGNGVGHTPPPPHPFNSVSDSETYDSFSKHLQARVTKASGRMAITIPDRPPSLPATPSHHHSGLHRSNSIKSDSAYSSTKHSSFNEDQFPRTDSFSQQIAAASSAIGATSTTAPISPTLSQSSRFTYPMSYPPPPSSASSPCMNIPAVVRSSTHSSLPYSLGKRASRDEDDSYLCKSNTLDYSHLSDYAYLSSVHGSTLSLVSSSSSVYSSAEDKKAHEIRKLKRDLIMATEKIHTLTSQLSTNAHVVSAFEQSLSNMTARLQSLTCNENKDSELNEIRMTIEALRRQSKMNFQEPVISPAAVRRHTSPAMKDLHITPGVGVGDVRMARQMSSDSVSSVNSLSSACSNISQHSGAVTDSEAQRRAAKANKKKGWLRSSFSKAFSSRKKGKTGSLSDCEPDCHSLRSNMSAPNSPLMQLGAPSMKGSHSSGALCDNDVNVLKQALRDKDMKLTDIRLEALSSAHQLEQLKETMMKMKNEMSALKADNDRLHKMVSTSSSSRSLNLGHGGGPGSHSGPRSPQHSINSGDSLDRSFSITDHSSLDMLLAETAANEREGKRVTISVVLGSNPDASRSDIDKPITVLIGVLSVSGKTKWDILDNVIRKIFKEYVLRVDPVTNLGLSAESLYSYVVGEISRTKDSEIPELLPIGYLVGDTMDIEICLKGTKQSCVDSLAFETMIPKTIIQRYISLLLEHRRIILCGPAGTGKTYLAQKLAEHVVLRSGRELTAGSVATFNVDHKSAKELRQYLANIAEQCENSNVHALPSAIILDNLHHVSSLADVFNGFLSVKYQKCPYIIGTMSQTSCSTTNLQLHHNFRFVLCANHMEVKGFLGRFLRRKLVEAEIRTGIRNNDLNRVVDWIPKVWAHLNKSLESHTSADVTIGPRLFMSCPMDIQGSQVWFTDLWNYTLVETVREGLQLYGCRSAWEDPTDWVLETYPWPNRGSGSNLLHIRADDLGFENQTPSSPGSLTNKIKSPVTENKEGDPLVNMLLRLQEAAGNTYTSTTTSPSNNNPHSNNDTDSIDSHNSIQDFSTSSGVESRL